MSALFGFLVGLGLLLVIVLAFPIDPVFLRGKDRGLWLALYFIVAVVAALALGGAAAMLYALLDFPVVWP